MRLLVIALTIFCIASFGNAFVSTKIVRKQSRKNGFEAHFQSKAMDSIITASAAIAAPVVVEYSLKTVIAKSLGYMIGIGAMALYSPIIIKLLKTKDSKGYSIQTWIFSIFGIGTQILYQYKKGFHISTYVELLITVVQSIGILGLISKFNGKAVEYVTGMTAAAALAAFLFTAKIPAQVLSAMQITSIFACNYALIPQILLSFKTKKATWSWITSGLSLTGCLLRIFTTLTLTKDPLVLTGFTIGAINNFSLLVQIYLYRNNK
jgi:mannose-P-dolichol utilization defect protein 1